jgi:hypothetical protein
VALRPAARIEATEAVVVTGARLGQVVLRRAAVMGLAVELIPVQRHPTAGGASMPAVALRLRWQGNNPPSVLLTALARLPDTAVTRPVAVAPMEGAAPLQGLLVDVRHQPPPAAALVAGLIPPGEAWLLGSPDVGNWRIEPRGAAIDGLTLLATKRVPTPPPPITTTDMRLPSSIPMAIGLLPDKANSARHPDAVLLLDDELAWTRRFLMARPAAAETAYLLPGPGRHLLLAPGGLLERVPFGVSLCWIGQEPLLVEQGQRFHPPLPAAARARMFAAGAEEVVVVVRHGPDELFVARYALSALCPAWHLWLADPPPVAAGITGRAAERLQALADRIDRERPRPPREPRLPILARLRLRPAGRDEQLRRALALEATGHLVAAAELLEQVGEPVRAARLYERAAGEVR